MAVTPETIAVALGRTAPAAESPEFEQWEMWIGDALMLIEARLGDLALLDMDKLDYVVREAVVAHVRRPDDATSVNVTVDDGGVSKQFKTATGRVTIRDEWWNLLSPTDGKSGAFSIFPSRCGFAHLPWCSLSMGALYCSCGVDIAGEPIFELDE